MSNVPKIPEHQSVYQQLYDMLLLGKVAPGQPLTIMGLAEMLSVGMTPVREALRRLAAEKAVTTLDNRRIVVPELSLNDINDIYFLRFELETELARRAAKFIEKKQIDRLTDIDANIDQALEGGDVELYLERNNQFHFMIYDIANSPVLFDTARSLWIRIGPSLRRVCGRYGTANLPDKHNELLQAFRAGDGRTASKAMRGDLQQSLTLVTTQSFEKI